MDDDGRPSGFSPEQWKAFREWYEAFRDADNHGLDEVFSREDTEAEPGSTINVSGIEDPEVFDALAQYVREKLSQGDSASLTKDGNWITIDPVQDEPDSPDTES